MILTGVDTEPATQETVSALDVNGNRRIEMPDILYHLQVIAEQRQP